MYYVFAGQVVGAGHLRRSRWLFMPLSFHQLVALHAQLHPGIRVDGVVDAMMAGNPAPQHLRIRGVHNAVNGKRGDVAEP